MVVPPIDTATPCHFPPWGKQFLLCGLGTKSDAKVQPPVGETCVLSGLGSWIYYSTSSEIKSLPCEGRGTAERRWKGDYLLECTRLKFI